MADEERGNYTVDQDDRHMIHVHTFNTEADVACEHQHIIQAVTGPARDSGNSHVHRVRGRTSFLSEGAEGHWHWFDVVSGPAIAMPEDTHTHFIDGETSYNDGHSHTFSDVVGIAPDMEDDEEDDTCDDDHKYKKHKKYREEEPAEE
ncbi:hypothetical protein P22_2993 [Propionispora sp. 2/2-37]|uniref:YmaF family protein n=1 Tax=Propionispora sp. 2/2-37 TaxID=1677858 RepID=UPI0006BB7498|nr:YmaF family protein [Propionispora sp. 2/2-37]CUH96881.1 hypothetical protein P22_2993 [Propionispora sp. 2/2-37]